MAAVWTGSNATVDSLRRRLAWRCAPPPLTFLPIFHQISTLSPSLQPLNPCSLQGSMGPVIRRSPWKLASSGGGCGCRGQVLMFLEVVLPWSRLFDPRAPRQDQHLWMLLGLISVRKIRGSWKASSPGARPIVSRQSRCRKVGCACWRSPAGTPLL
jgi:hypothetical protein